MTTENNSVPDSITFLGTGGARFMIISQLLASGGLWFNFGGTEILMDPEPGSIIQTVKNKLNPEKLSAIIVSHRHLDHSADVNIMVEAMTRGGFRKEGRLFAPADALETEPVIFDYLKKRLDSVETLVPGGSYTVGNVTFTTPVLHIHPVENYGMVFQTGKYKIAYITDTSYFPDLKKHYHGDLLMMNVVFMEPRFKSDVDGMPINHLALPDAERLIREIKPKIAILTHFGTQMWNAKPQTVAERLTEQTGTRTIAATDGMVFQLSELDKF